MTILKPRDTWDEFPPSWPCSCGDGEIRLDAGKVVKVETIESEMANHRDPQPWSDHRFVYLALCNGCYEHSTVGGVVHTSFEEQAEPDQRFAETVRYKADLFSPGPMIVPRRDGMSRKVGALLLRAETHSWGDVPAAANSLRSSIEQFLTDCRIPTEGKTKTGKRRRRPLHERIELFKKKHPELGDHLLAVKWLGNDGTHADAKLTRDDLFDAFEQFDHVLEQVYDGTLDKLRRKAAAINKRKGPVRRKA